MAVRAFNGSSDLINTATGALATNTFGTQAVIVKRGATGGWHTFLALHNSGGTALTQFGYSSADLTAMWKSVGPDSSTGPAAIATTAWGLIVYRKASGTATGRFSLYNFSTATWTHGAANISMGNWTSPGASGTVRVEWQGANDRLNGRLAIRAAWNSLPWLADTTGDAAIEAAGLHASAANWLAASPDAMWLFNQAAVTEAVADVTSNGADQTSRTGTTVITTDDPPGFSFDLSSGTNGTASGIYGINGVAAGVASGVVAASGSYGLDGAATGIRRVLGQASSNYGVNGAATALPPFVTSIGGTGTAQHFVDQGGAPILIRGYVIWGLLMNAGRWGGTWQADLEAAVAGLATIGVNVLYTEPLGNTQNGGATNDGATWDGVLPFTGGDLAAFNNTFWERSDYLFNLCLDAGITVFFNLAYSTDLDVGALSGLATADFTDYGTSLATRYQSRPNLVWMIGGDYFDTFNTQLTAMLTAIRAEGDTHLFGVQNYPETTSRFDIENNAVQNTGTDNSDFNFVYSYNVTYWGIEYAYAEASPLTVLWGDGHFDQDSIPDRKVMRDLTWWAFTSGARGNILGSEGTWAWNSGALANLTTDTFPNTDQPIIWDVFTGLDGWHLLRPDTDSSLVTAGRGTKSDYVTGSGGGGGEYNSSDTQCTYVTAGVTADGSLAVVYCPVSTTVTIDDTELVASYTARWVDPASGASTPTTIAATYGTPGSNSLGGDDWLLVFEEFAGQLGAASGTYGVDGTATGARRVIGTASGSFGWDGVASGTSNGVVTGVASGSYGFNGVVTVNGTMIGDAFNLHFIALAPEVGHGAALAPEVAARTALAPELGHGAAGDPETAHGNAGAPALDHGDPDAPETAHGQPLVEVGHGQPGEPEI